jgi:hypothetical protein
VFSQNDPLESPAHLKDYNLNNLIGYLRPEGNEMPWSDNEVREMFGAVRHDFLGQNPAAKDLDADMGAAKDRQKEPNDWALSEFIHDRFKEMKTPNCTTQVNQAITDTKNYCKNKIKECADRL